MTSNPTPQRSLRGHRPKHPAPRVRNSPDHHAWLAGHLTPRDRWLMRMLFEHKVFTSHQIIDLAFPSRRAANLRLHNLYEWGVLHRFQPHRDLGSHPMHYVLDLTGATVLAHEEGVDPGTLKYSRNRALGRAYSHQLAHDVACNSLFTSLIRHARQPRTTGRLTAWWSAARCRRLWGDIVTPDGYGRWHEAGREIEWLMEFDFGTEPLPRLTAKLRRYARLVNETGVITPILFWLPTPARETSARRVLFETLQTINTPDRVPTATTNTTIAGGTLDLTTARWLRLDSQPSADRVPLTNLATLWPDLPAPTRVTGGDFELSGDTRAALAAPTPMPPPDIDYRKSRSAA